MFEVFANDDLYRNKIRIYSSIGNEIFDQKKKKKPSLSKMFIKSTEMIGFFIC